MPSLNEMVKASSTMQENGYTPVEKPTGVVSGLPPNTQQLPSGSGFMRCPIPPIFSSNPDSQRQFYVGGQVPQMRVYTPAIKTS